MKTITKSLLCAVALTVCGTMRTSALPGSTRAQSATDGAQQSRQVEQVRYHGRGGYYGGRHGYRGNNGRNIGIGIGSAIVGGIILNEAARAEHRNSNSDAWERCASTYRSFEPSTGMYTGYDGERHTCPYLN